MTKVIKDIKIPNKSLFKLDEVCSLTSVKPYVLRFWEGEFHQIAPLLSSTGQKLFEHKDIEAVLHIKELLFDKKLTIEKAKFELDKIYQEQSQESEEFEKFEPLGSDLSLAKELLAKMITTTKDIQASHNW